MVRGFRCAGLAVAFGVFVAGSGSAAPGAGYGFSVDITLSPRAAALLAAKHEMITVSAEYSGDPIPSKMKLADEMGEIDLGGEDVTIPGTNGRAVISGRKFIAAHAGWVKVPQVLINVFTARHSDPNNLLDCGIFEDALSKAQAAPIQIHCKVIGEP